MSSRRTFRVIKAMVWFWGGLYASLPFVLPFDGNSPIFGPRPASSVSADTQIEATAINALDWQGWPADDAYSASCVCEPIRIRFAHPSPLGHDRQRIMAQTFEAIGEELEAMGLADHESCRLIRANIRYLTIERLNQKKDAGAFGKRVAAKKSITGLTSPGDAQGRQTEVYVAKDLKPDNVDATLAHELAHLWWFKLDEPGAPRFHDDTGASIAAHEGFAERVERRFKEKNRIP
jgi:hypothetical protein